MFECIAYADVFAPGFWTTEAYDYNIRSSDASSTFTTTLDDNQIVSTGGQDWFIYAQDVDMLNHLCTAHKTDDNFDCSALRCTTRREISPSDTNDISFVNEYKSLNTDTMYIAAGNARLYINQQDLDASY